MRLFRQAENTEMTMIESAYALLAGNQLLAGGIGTLAFGSAMYLLRTIPEKLLAAIQQTIWIKLSIESLANEYGDVDAFIERLRFDFSGRSLELRDGAVRTGFGRGWGRYDGTVFSYEKKRSGNQLAPFETIVISFLTRDRQIVERFMSDCRPETHRNSIYVSTYAASGFSGGVRRRKRGLDTVFVDEAIKQRLVERMHWFLGAEAWHAARGVPWKFGVVLHGPPGTGKTSLIHALASDFGFNIKYVNSLQGLGTAFLTGARDDLFVIEDIDAISGGLNRATAERTSGRGAAEAFGGAGSGLHEVLNAMDGMQTPDGLKFIVTTNHIERLDPAIVRPGRIDEVIEVGPLSLDSARRMFRAFYGRDGIADYAPRTGAELQSIFSTLEPREAEAFLARDAGSRTMAIGGDRVAA
jgi:chaperone BCS1